MVQSGEVVGASLGQAGGVWLALTVTGYAQTDAPPAGSAWGDAGRLEVLLEAGLDGRRWRARGPLLSTADLDALVAWAHLVAEGRVTDPLETAEPGFGMTGRRRGDTVLLRVRLSHALAPPFLDADEPEGSEGVALRFRLGVPEFGAWAARLEGYRRAYPRR